jgi:drug/metabolite transporter (DMT)-like permease
MGEQDGGAVERAQLAAMAMAIFTVASLIDEGIVRIVVAEGERLGWFLALLQSPAVFLPSLLRRCRSGRGLSTRLRSGFMPAHVVLGFGLCLSHGLSSAALMHVNYTEQQMFKCAKVAFVMAASWVMLGTVVSRSSVLAAAMLVSVPGPC